MSHTLVGVFNTHAQALEAKKSLIAQGFADASVQVQAHPGDSGTGDTVTTAAAHEEEGFGASISRFFKGLFGDDDVSEVGHYSEAVRRGNAVVAVTVSDDKEEAQRAQFALVDAGAVDINDRAAAWSKEGYQSFDPVAKPYSAAQVEAERGKFLPVVRDDL